MPVPVDSPGTLRPVLYRWFNSYLGLFSTGGNAFLYWKVFCFVLLLTVPAMAVVNYNRILDYLWLLPVRLPLSDSAPE